MSVSAVDPFLEYGPPHIIARGDSPNRRKGEVEVYSSKRFFTVTGHLVEVSGD